jgi:hypothetical protein
VLEEAFKRYEGVIESATRDVLDRLARGIMEATGCAESAAFAALRVVTTLAFWASSDEEGVVDIDEIVESIRANAAEAGLDLTHEEEPRLREVINRLTLVSEKTKNAEARGVATTGFLPSFQSLQATLELRSTLLPGQFGDDTTEPALELIPVASIRLDLDSGEPDFICFQATEDHLTILQAKVESLREGLRRLKERVQVTPR